MTARAHAIALTLPTTTARNIHVAAVHTDNHHLLAELPALLLLVSSPATGGFLGN
jgi:hypothetical protein